MLLMTLRWHAAEGTVLTRTTLGWIAGAAVSALMGTALGLLVDGELVLRVLVSITVCIAVVAAVDSLEDATGRPGRAGKG
jgi:uncharacterized membrane protein YfcA